MSGMISASPFFLFSSQVQDVSCEKGHLFRASIPDTCIGTRKPTSGVVADDGRSGHYRVSQMSSAEEFLSLPCNRDKQFAYKFSHYETWRCFDSARPGFETCLEKDFLGKEVPYYNKKGKFSGSRNLDESVRFQFNALFSEDALLYTGKKQLEFVDFLKKTVFYDQDNYYQFCFDESTRRDEDRRKIVGGTYSIRLIACSRDYKFKEKYLLFLDVINLDYVTMNSTSKDSATRLEKLKILRDHPDLCH